MGDQQQPQQVAINGQTYKVNDFVLVNQQGNQDDFEVGRIVSIVEPEAADGEQQLSLLRFLKPEQVLGGRQPFHGDKELIESDDVLQVPLSAVQARARVFSLNKFQSLAQVGALDFFARLGYKAAQEEFVPQRLPVFCRCEMPYNPDKFMVQCSSCMEWYHPECLQVSVRALSAQAKWKCPDCSAATGAQQPGGTDEGLLAAEDPLCSEDGDL